MCYAAATLRSGPTTHKITIYGWSTTLTGEQGVRSGRARRETLLVESAVAPEQAASASQGVEAGRQLQAVRAHEAGVGEHFPGGAVGDDLAVVEHQ